jgi:ATP-binding protein involved in chromosome partitioning
LQNDSKTMSFSKSDIIKALSTVEDPDLKRDLVSLNMVKDVMVDTGGVGLQ